MNSICFNCFHYKPNDEACPNCGYDQRSGEGKYPTALHPGTHFADQYFLGRVLSKDDLCFTYLAFGRYSKSRVLIKEYFPEQLCFRKDGENLIQLKDASLSGRFEAGKQDFLSRNLSRSANSIFQENGTVYYVLPYGEKQDIKPSEEQPVQSKPQSDGTTSIISDDIAQNITQYKKKRVTGLIVGGILLIALIISSIIGTRTFKKSAFENFSWGDTESTLIVKDIITRQTGGGYTYFKANHFIGADKTDKYFMPSVDLYYSKQTNKTGIQAIRFHSSAKKGKLLTVIGKIRLYYGKPEGSVDSALFTSSDIMQMESFFMKKEMKSMYWLKDDQIVTLTWETDGGKYAIYDWELFIMKYDGDPNIIETNDSDKKEPQQASTDNTDNNNEAKPDEQEPETNQGSQTAYSNPDNTVTPDGSDGFLWYIGAGDFTVRVTGAFAKATPDEGDPELKTVGSICLDDYSKILQIWVADIGKGLSYSELSDEKLEFLTSQKKKEAEKYGTNVESGVFRAEDIVWIWDSCTALDTDFAFYDFVTQHNGKYIDFQFSFSGGVLSDADRHLCEDIIQSLKTGKN